MEVGGLIGLLIDVYWREKRHRSPWFFPWTDCLLGGRRFQFALAGWIHVG